ncbi:MAG: Ycf66 family protein [Synechococcus sp.]
MLDTTNPMFLMGALVAIASAGFFSLRYFRPTASREYDVVFAIVGFIYAVTLMWEGWRLIPLLAFAQLLLVGSATFFAVESFRLRLQLTERARQTVGGPGPSRRGPRGFTKTYRPDEYDSRRTVEARSTRSRMRKAGEDDESPRRRKLRSANGLRPRLASGTEARRTSRRPRPTRPPRDEFDGEFDDQNERYGDERRSDNFPKSRRPSGRPSRVRPSRGNINTIDDEFFSDRDDSEDRYERDDYSSNAAFDDDSFPDEPRISRRPAPSNRPSSRRRPPQIPDDMFDDNLDDFDSELDDGFEDDY